MKGKYHMMDWEQEKWEREVSAVISKLSQDQSYIADFTNFDVCPANLCKTLENLGWKQLDIDRNGWENDTWHYYKHHNYDFNIIVYYEGYTFKLEMYSSLTEF